MGNLIDKFDLLFISNEFKISLLFQLNLHLIHKKYKEKVKDGYCNKNID